jgi:hypothetical protein
VPDGGVIGYIPKDLVVRSSVAPETLIPAVRSAINKADPQQPVSDVALYTDVLEVETAPRAAQLRVLGAFAGVALLLAGVGRRRATSCAWSWATVSCSPASA